MGLVVPSFLLYSYWLFALFRIAMEMSQCDYQRLFTEDGSKRVSVLILSKVLFLRSLHFS